jgi:hypothetical protein
MIREVSFTRMDGAERNQLVRFLEEKRRVSRRSSLVSLVSLVGLILVAVAAGACGRTGDGVNRRLSLGFAPETHPIAVGVELALAVERPTERGHFCVGHCALDKKLQPISLERVVSSRPDRVQVVSLDDSDPRAPLVRIRTLTPGPATLSVTARAGGRVFDDAWTLEARRLSRIEVSQTRLPENSQVELTLRPVDAEGREVYAGEISSRLEGAAELFADQRVAVEVKTNGPGPATLELKTAIRTQLTPLQVGPEIVARAR